ncbi:MAG: ion transporter [Porphyromonas sp.]|nr:ion transporter [Porphyromonas sp.]
MDLALETMREMSDKTAPEMEPQKREQIAGAWYSKERLYEILFGTNTPAGKRFDKILLALVVLSVLVVFIDSSVGTESRWKQVCNILEWIFTLLFTVEYLLRLYCSVKVVRYAFSFYGIVDLLSTLPTYLAIAFSGTHYMLVLRVFRLLRLFRVFRMGGAIQQSHLLYGAIRRSAPKIAVFMLFIVVLVSILGSIMYLVEGDVNPMFNDIPRSVYWAVITITTVGYGDITPVTWMGQLISMVVMLLGYSIIAVPTGIVSSEFTKSEYLREHPEQRAKKKTAKPLPARGAVYCYACGHPSAEADAIYCCRCGTVLLRPDTDETKEEKNSESYNT